MMQKTPQLIIDRPDLQTWRQRAVFGALTAAFWVGWFVLWLPAITMAGWLFFGLRFKFHMIDLDGFSGFLGLLGIYALVIVGMGGSLLLWAKYNHLRFRGVERRRDFPVPTLADIATAKGLSEAAILDARRCQIMTVHHDDHGGILRVENRYPPAQAMALPVKAVDSSSSLLATSL
ncbi:poly-beta-1,6-N-acetyl-D-glucosamine biosynthesis protein PgaD [Pelomonas sp. V22]|uniref:poly-beta-1,6-N-acetyl-D-glucosamine biosynthesis protein PgaD n=1 Tax=Pelomonas sp. V22 TaxID=2822139 RepID=UPI0024A85763|nr:poly-beta-1,6-N-acetyl-D-glucosamine biosynthesis protein PgaD [Pelomonas sp. V22]MDI4633871.1 poly-beta-1,6-N-acetyl-D-glucosamine biosynthesis protein PgaD [Pelomonas sp. V22]